MKLWIGNMAPEVTDEELREFLGKYGLHEIAVIERVPGDGSRPGAIISFAKTDIKQLGALALRLDGLFWKGRRIVVQTTLGLGEGEPGR
jgi:RNA recognition motif-containing protein